MKAEPGVGGRVFVVYLLNGQQVAKQFDITAEENIGRFLQRRQCRNGIPAVVRNRDYGVFGQLASPDTPLSDGDRLEFYQPLITSPRQKRARLAALAMRKKCTGANSVTL